ncbi:MAG: [protein-PII] uridylyltransferase [Deltaproteobacteria bacterium]|nr:MAG: [protein-PII] uridylyltransferase [Deltaproteobacteria bacterium]
MNTALFAKNLKEKKEKLCNSYFNGNGYKNFQQNLAGFYDEYFIKSFESISSFKTPFAVAALGGYGRQEQAPFSDIDILFIFKDKKKSDSLVKEILYPLWDNKFNLGYSIRTVSECIEEAKSELFNLTSMLDSRFICGFSPIYIDFVENFRKYLSLYPKKLTENILQSSTERHARYGDSEYLLEPDIKNGKGGLRDYHSIRWAGKINFNLQSLKDFQYHGYLSESEFPEFIKSIDFIANVRNLLHIMNKKKSDKLYFDYQSKIALKMGFVEEKGRNPVENFLGKLHSKMNFLNQISLMIQNEVGRPKKLGIKRVYKKKTRIKGLDINNSLIGFKNSGEILKEPSLLIKIFKESGRKKVDLNAESKRLVSEFGHLVDDKFRQNKENIADFEKILSFPYMHNHPLDAMFDCGMLGFLIPEFKEIMDRIQYNDYHIYPVGRHSIRSVQYVQRLASGESRAGKSQLYQSVYSEIKPKKILLWAVLLHDIGKGVSGESHADSGAEIAKKILSRFEIKKSHIDTISFLIKNHLYMVKTATRRDVNDEETIAACALKIKSVMRLKMLFFLTLADSMATGPKTWSEWTENLISSLFLKTLLYLEHGSLSGARAINFFEKKSNELIKLLEKYSNKPEKIISLMPAGYIFELTNSEIIIHANLYMEMLQSEKPFAFKVEKKKKSGLRRVFICAKDKPGFFSSVAGVFTINNMNIMDARAFGWKNSMALSIFTVSAPLDTVYEELVWEKTENDIENVLLGKINIEKAVKKKNYGFKNIFHTTDKIKTDNKGSGFYSIMEVHTNDYPGLLFDLTSVLFQCKTDIRKAKIATNVTKVIDVFYLRSFNGQKLSDENIEVLKNKVLKKLSEIKEDL